MANQRSLTQIICNLSPYLQKLILLSIITLSSIQLGMAANVNLVEIDMITVTNPLSLALTPDGNKLYAVTYPTKINVIATLTKQVVANIPLSGGRPFEIAITPDGRNAYLAISNASGDSASGSPNRVEVIDVSTDTITTTIPISGSPYGPIGTAITPNGSEVYITVRGSNKVDVIDTAINTVVHSITVGGLPIAVAITSDGSRAYVVSRANSTVYVIDTGTKTIIATILLSIGPNASSNKIALDTDYAYVTYVGFGDIAIIDINPTSPTFHQQIGIIPTSGTDLRGIAIDSQGKMALVASYDTNELLVIDTDPNSLTFHTQIGSVSVGNRPFYVASQSLPIAAAYVSNYSSDNTISVVGYPTELLVKLHSFNATATPEGTHVTWNSDREVDIMAFDLWRGIPKQGFCTNNPTNYREIANPSAHQIIYTTGNQSFYEFYDEFAAQSNIPYCYVLFTINENGAREPKWHITTRK